LDLPSASAVTVVNLSALLVGGSPRALSDGVRHLPMARLNSPIV
jgi:hypothetical protein